MSRPSAPSAPIPPHAGSHGNAGVASGAVVAGALILPAGDPRIPRWQRRLALANPAYQRGRRHGRGRPPEATIHPVGTIDAGPWAGGALVPRHAPDVAGEDRTTWPPAERLTLRGELRGYQRGAVDRVIRARGGVVQAPCGAGKTVIGCALIAEHATPAIVLVHTTDLLEQWRAQIESFLGIEAQVIGDGRRAPALEAPPARVTIATLQTLSRLGWWQLHQLGQRWGLVIYDEAHHVPARTFALVAAGLPGRLRVGLTATPERADGLTPWLRWIIGPMVATISPADLEAAGRVLAPSIQWLDAPPVDVEGLEAHERDERLARDGARNELIVDAARELVDRGRKILVLVRLVAHAHALVAALVEAGYDAAALVGELPSGERAELLERMRQGTIEIVVATSIADEGLDAPRLDTLILAAPTGNLGRLEQRIGRVCRPHPEARPPLVVDLADSAGILRHFARQRAQLYRSRGWQEAS